MSGKFYIKDEFGYRSTAVIYAMVNIVMLENVVRDYWPLTSIVVLIVCEMLFVTCSRYLSRMYAVRDSVLDLERMAKNPLLDRSPKVRDALNNLLVASRAHFELKD